MSRRPLRMLTVLCVFATVWSTSQADVVLEWNDIMQTTLVGQSPVNETRLAAITQLAVFEAVNAITGQYDPYLGTVRAPRSASAEAAAIAAAHGVLWNYVLERRGDLDAARAKSLAGIPDGPAKTEGIAAGEAAAKAMIDLREDDGSTPARSYLPDSAKAGEWQLTPGCPPTGGVALNWGEVTPFGIPNLRWFRAESPPRLGSRRYATDFNELKRVGGQFSTDRPQDRADVANFYAAVLAVRTWNPVAQQVALAQRRSLSENARALALLNMAMNDALVAVFDSKYRDPFWRPETAIRAGDSDGNRGTRADPNFAPFVVTPCHPSYPSAHASAGYAARAVLERVYGRWGHFIVLSSPAVPGVSLEYRRFDQITSDIDDARIYGGIHFRFDQEAGARQGTSIGRYIVRHSLRPEH